MCGAERPNTRHVGVGVRAVIRLVPWDNPRQASGTRVRCQVRPNKRLQPRLTASAALPLSSAAEAQR